MKPETLEQLIAQGESESLEFKKPTTQLKAAGETLCAFLNGKGGVVLLGVLDDGRIIGQQVADQTCQEVAQLIQQIEPPAHITIDYIAIANKQVIKLSAYSNEHLKPYVYNGRPY